MSSTTSQVVLTGNSTSYVQSMQQATQATNQQVTALNNLAQATSSTHAMAERVGAAIGTVLGKGLNTVFQAADMLGGSQDPVAAWKRAGSGIMRGAQIAGGQMGLPLYGGPMGIAASVGMQLQQESRADSKEFQSQTEHNMDAFGLAGGAQNRTEASMRGDVEKIEQTRRELDKRNQEITEKMKTSNLIVGAVTAQNWGEMFNRTVSGGQIGGAAEQASNSSQRETLLQSQNQLRDEIGKKEERTNEILRTRLELRSKEASLMEIADKYAEQIRTAHDKQEKRTEQALKDRQKLEEEQVERSDRWRKEDLGAQAGMEIYSYNQAAYRAQGADTLATREGFNQRRYALEQEMRKQQERDPVAFQEGDGGRVASMQIDKEQQAFERQVAMRKEALQVEREIAGVTGTSGQKALSAALLRIEATQRLLENEKDEVKQEELKVQLAQQQNALTEAQKAFARELRGVRGAESQGRVLDVEGDIFGMGAREQRRTELKVQEEQVRDALDEGMAAQTPQEKQAAMNRLKGIRNQINQDIYATQMDPERFLNFSADSMTAVGGGGNIGTVGKPVDLLEQQTKLLESIDQSLTDIKNNNATPTTADALNML